jgi:hypothetical protein
MYTITLVERRHTLCILQNNPVAQVVVQFSSPSQHPPFRCSLGTVNSGRTKAQLLGLSQSDGVAAEVIDAVPFSQEAATGR